MDSSVLNAQHFGMLPGAGYGEANRIALQRASNELKAAGGGTIFIPAGIYEIAGAIEIEVSTAATADGTIRITGEDGPTLVQQDENSLFLVTEAGEESDVGHVVLEGLTFQGNHQPATP